MDDGEGMAIVRILLVEDDEVMSSSLTSLLAQFGCAITTATNVPQALRYISSETYNVLLSDLHMLGSGDGSSVINAMRHANPEAVTLLLNVPALLRVMGISTWSDLCHHHQNKLTPQVAA
jgi:CheY-like chemotaxis protein